MYEGLSGEGCGDGVPAPLSLRSKQRWQAHAEPFRLQGRPTAPRLHLDSARIVTCLPCRTAGRLMSE